MTTEPLKQKIVVFPEQLPAFKAACMETDDLYFSKYDERRKAIVRFKDQAALFMLGQNFLYFKRKLGIL